MYFVKRGRIPLLGLNELKENSQATIIRKLKFVIKLSRAYSFRKISVIGQNLKHVCMIYSFFKKF